MLPKNKDISIKKVFQSKTYTWSVTIIVKTKKKSKGKIKIFNY